MIAGICLLNGCGFQLRGIALVPASLQPVAIVDETDDRDLKRTILETLEQNHIQISDNPGAQSILTLKQLSLQENIVSVSSGVGARQYQLNLSVKYQWLLLSNHTINPQQNVQLARQYTQNTNRILGSSDEKEQLILEMKQEIAIILINQMTLANHAHPVHAVHHKST